MKQLYHTLIWDLPIASSPKACWIFWMVWAWVSPSFSQCINSVRRIQSCCMKTKIRWTCTTRLYYRRNSLGMTRPIGSKACVGRVASSFTPKTHFLRLPLILISHILFKKPVIWFALGPCSRRALVKNKITKKKTNFLTITSHSWHNSLFIFTKYSSQLTLWVVLAQWNQEHYLQSSLAKQVPPPGFSGEERV